jgi:DNA-binding FrmR family transcriptional regulator
MIVFHDLPYIPYGGIVQAMDEKLKKSQLARLSRIEGQVRGVARMIEEDRYCIDVLTQIRAVRAALDKVEQETLSDHLQHCVAHAFHAGSENDRQTKIDELLEVLDSRRR